MMVKGMESIAVTLGLKLGYLFPMCPPYASVFPSKVEVISMFDGGLEDYQS